MVNVRPLVVRYGRAKAALRFASVSRESTECAIRDLLTAAASPGAKSPESSCRSWS